MVYIRNIINLHNEMKENEILKIGFKSGKSLTLILKSDKLSTQAGDLRIERTNKIGRCITILDPAEIECMSIITSKGEINGN